MRTPPSCLYFWKKITFYSVLVIVPMPTTDMISSFLSKRKKAARNGVAVGKSKTTLQDLARFANSDRFGTTNISEYYKTNVVPYAILRTFDMARFCGQNSRVLHRVLHRVFPGFYKFNISLHWVLHRVFPGFYKFKIQYFTSPGFPSGFSFGFFGFSFWFSLWKISDLHILVKISDLQAVVAACKMQQRKQQATENLIAASHIH